MHAPHTHTRARVCVRSYTEEVDFLQPPVNQHRENKFQLSTSNYFYVELLLKTRLFPFMTDHIYIYYHFISKFISCYLDCSIVSQQPKIISEIPFKNSDYIFNLKPINVK